ALRHQVLCLRAVAPPVRGYHPRDLIAGAPAVAVEARKDQGRGGCRDAPPHQAEAAGVPPRVKLRPPNRVGGQSRSFELLVVDRVQAPGRPDGIPPRGDIFLPRGVPVSAFSWYHDQVVPFVAKGNTARLPCGRGSRANLFGHSTNAESN